MRLISEIVDEKSKILLVCQYKYLFIDLIKNYLEKLGSDFFYSPKKPVSLDSFDYVIFVDYNEPLKNLLATNKKIILIYLDNQQKALRNVEFLSKNKITNVKIISLSLGKISEKEIERIIWFIFSTDKENYIHFRLFQNKAERKITKKQSLKDWLLSSKIKILKTFIILIFIFYFLAIPFQILSLYFTYKSASSLKSQEINDSKMFLSYSEGNLYIVNKLYKITRPAYLLFSLALFTDNLYEINRISNMSLTKVLALSDNGKVLISDIVKTNKSDDEIRSQIMRFDMVISDLNSLQKNLNQLVQKLPDKPKVFIKLKTSILDEITVLSNGKSALPLLKDILGIEKQKKYLLLFANNMEIRPGGGFIGSYGILTANKLTIEKIEIFDVYDADGQLKTHIDPPPPIRKYLNQPHWYLRDSAFSFDFVENYNQAKMFLREELNLNGFSGGFIITTSAIQNLLEAMNEIYLSDYQEKINKDNFYIKAQLYAEKDFFPGSIQKKSFLGSLSRQIFLNLNSASFPTMLKMLNKSLEEKQIAVFFEDEKIQEEIDSKHWSGKVIPPNCLYQLEHCVIDYIFPVDANLGVNKANFFVTKKNELKVKILKDGTINNELIIKIRNDSQNNIFPGGLYKNYFQIALPSRSLINKITVNNTLVENFDTKIDIYKTIGFLIEIDPQQSSEIKIDYKLTQPLDKDERIYQLIFQKQIGSKNSDLSLKFKIPKNMSLETQNFSPIVKEDSIIYNTSLTGDKIFILKLKNK